MATDLEHTRPRAGPTRFPIYPDDIRPRLQSLLASLADIDIAHEKRLDSIRNSTADETQKREVIERLRKRHLEHRAPYVRQLAELQKRIEALFR